MVLAKLTGGRQRCIDPNTHRSCTSRAPASRKGKTAQGRELSGRDPSSSGPAGRRQHITWLLLHNPMRSHRNRAQLTISFDLQGSNYVDLAVETSHMCFHITQTVCSQEEMKSATVRKNNAAMYNALHLHKDSHTHIHIYTHSGKHIHTNIHTNCLEMPAATPEWVEMHPVVIESDWRRPLRRMNRCGGSEVQSMRLVSHY